MSKINWTHEFWLCMDCTMQYETGDAGEDRDHDHDPLSDLKDFEIAGDFNSTTDVGHDHFSARRCDGCGTTLAGDRYRYAGRANDHEGSLGACGCTDYHMADCPTRTGYADSFRDHDDYDPYDY